jgi:hypothetical protein
VDARSKEDTNHRYRLAERLEFWLPNLMEHGRPASEHSCPGTGDDGSRWRGEPKVAVAPNGQSHEGGKGDGVRLAGSGDPGPAAAGAVGGRGVLEGRRFGLDADAALGEGFPEVDGGEAGGVPC